MPPKGAAPLPRSVARAVVIKDEGVFFLAEHDGGVPATNQDGFGLYYHDCRFLDGYELRIAGTVPNPLAASAHGGSVAQFALTNQSLELPSGKSLAQQTFGLTLERAIDGGERTVRERLTIENYDVREHSLPLSLRFHAGFEDVFEIRGLHPKRVGAVNAPRWDGGVLVLSYHGADAIERRLEIEFDPKPDKTTASGANFEIAVQPGQRVEININMRIVEMQTAAGAGRSDVRPTEKGKADEHRSRDWLAEHARLRSDHPVLDAVMRRSLLDLLVLRGELDGLRYFSAGLPWYGTLFGRDSIIAALQTLAFEPGIAAETIRLLARYQGSKVDEWRDEQPGKILHELRRGELANLNEIPQTPYYGSVDATPLFLILVGEHAHWTGDLELFRELRSNVERALQWIDTYGDEGGNGYLSYASKSKKGLGNQGWKDSGDSIMNANGSLATPPIALVEVQGYVFRAKRLMADLYARAGDKTSAGRLRREADDLRTRFERDFWIKERAFYAIALQRGGRPAEVISSNPGQALWSGIVDDGRAAAVVRRLMADDMFSGWGIRTLSTAERRSNPIGYHLGTVWPHDNSIIAAGFRRYGFDEQALRVFDGILQAALDFPHYRLPEVFAGFSRREFTVPVRYPVACHPQAWAAGSVPFLMTSLLGLMPDAFAARLRVVRPVLPQVVNTLELRGVKVGAGSADLRFRRASNGQVEVEVTGATGNVRVEVESASQRDAA